MKENYKSEFDYKLPANQWTHIVMTGVDTGTFLFMNGNEYAVTLKDGSRLETWTCMEIWR